jgi:ABC-2 type transport system permease protein
VKILAIAGSNLRRFVRDRSNLFFVFILPIGIVLLIGAQFSGDFSPVMGITPASTEFGADVVEQLESDDAVNTAVYVDEAEMILDVERGTIGAGLSVPANADELIAAGETVELGFVTRPDGFGPQLQTVAAEAVSDVTLERTAVAFAVDKGADPDVASDIAAAADVPRIAVSTVTAGDALFEGVSGRFDIGASSQLVLFMFLTGLTGSAALIQSRQLGVTRRMVGSPTSVGTIVMGEAIGRFLIVLIQGLYIVGTTALFFGVDWGDPLGSAAVVILFAAVGAGAAMLFGTLFRNDQQAGGVSVVAGIGLAALGGSMLPIELFSPTMETVARFTPHAWANEAFAELLRRQATVADIAPQLGVLALFAAVLLVLATWRMRVVIRRS